MSYHDVIGDIARNSKYETYLELGVNTGVTFFKVAPYVKEAIGVDHCYAPSEEQLRNHKNATIIKSKTDDFFKSFNKPLDLVFIDADHHFEAALKDFENSLHLLKKGGCIILHDTDPIDASHQGQQLCGDCYRLVDILEARHDLNIVTLPIWAAGLSIVTRKGETRTQLRNKPNL